MTIPPFRAIHRRALLAAGCVVALAGFLALSPSTPAEGAGPDVTVFDFTDIRSYGAFDGFAAYAIGTNACNRGDKPLNWCDQANGCAPGAGTNDHPVIAQNLYRLKDGRFDQIGMSWLKHGFASLNGNDARCTGASGQSCQFPDAGDNQLGVGCFDPYDASTNGLRPLGRRSEVNAANGEYPFPVTVISSPQVYDQRIKVATTDVDPAFNIGATYWAEGQYVAGDDAVAGNGLNNASFQRAFVGVAPAFPLTLTGPFYERQPAINAWKLQDPNVELFTVDVPGQVTERFHVGRKVTALGGGLWHYEYAVHNLNSDRSARAFEVVMPGTVAFTNVGFKDVDSHSGEPYSTDDWSVVSSGGRLAWETDTFATDPNANALRFGTLYNFWFDADRPPTGLIVHTLQLFKPGEPESVSFLTGNDLFADGFESGGTGQWSGSLLTAGAGATSEEDFER